MADKNSMSGVLNRIDKLRDEVAEIGECDGANETLAEKAYIRYWMDLKQKVQKSHPDAYSILLDSPLEALFKGVSEKAEKFSAQVISVGKKSKKKASTKKD